MNATTHLIGPNFHGAIETCASIIIDAAIEKVWQVLLDLPSYGEWNPFLRAATMVDRKTRTPTGDQTLRTGSLVRLLVAVPPSLDGASPRATTTHELVSLVDHAAHRITWGGAALPALFRGEQCQAVSATPDGRTRFEIKKAVGGVLAHPVRWIMGAEGFQRGCDAMAAALKERAEKS